MYLGLKASDGVNMDSLVNYWWVSGAAGFTFSLHNAISKSPLVVLRFPLFFVANLNNLIS